MVLDSSKRRCDSFTRAVAVARRLIERQFGLLNRLPFWRNWLVDTCLKLRLGRKKLCRHPTKNVVDDRLREPYLRILGHTRRLKPNVRKFIDQYLQGNTVLQRIGHRLRERGSEPRDRRPFLRHDQKNLSR